MADSSGSLDYWRKFFRSANSDIFQVIEHAVLVAASDYPEEFRSRRDRMVEKLFTVLLPRCFGCDRVAEGEEWNASVKRDGEKESKVDSNNVGPEDLNRIVSNYSFDEAEALTEEIEEEGQIVGEVLRIKDIFANHHDEVCAIAPLINSTSLNNGEFEKQWENGRMLKANDEPERKQQPPKQPVIPKEKGEARRQELVIRQAKPQEHLVSEAKHEIIVNKQCKPVMSGPGRQLKLASNQKAHSEMKTTQHQDNVGVQRKPPMFSQDVSLSER
ncbi:hypothetical protein B296_00003831 [Ensete ventricosum]|uniref:Uncharacterized protein n=1 Tax=Ensete ventricosum TaxID=4639 RepID=A0A426ZVP8_ENSVE|nr:hypothetical protein B296_00003831 [Ensete ventricosum]